MRKNSDLDDTKPIQIINEDSSDMDEDSVVMTRTEKYKDRDEDLEELPAEEPEIVTQEIKELVEITAAEKEAVESAEEALTEKNINEAEKLLEAEKKEKEKDEEPKKKESLIDKWKKLSKKKKILSIVIAIIVLAIIITLLVILLGKGNKKDEKKKETKKEEKINIVDNYYYKDGKLHILSSKQDELGVYECKDKEEDKCYVAINTYRDSLDVPRVLDEKGNEKVERMPVYNDEYVFIHDEDKIILYSLNEKAEKGVYQEVKAYDGNFLILKDSSSKYGLYQFKEALNIVISPVYNKLYMIDGRDELVAENGKGYVIINKVGKILSSVISTTGVVKYYNTNYLVVSENNKYSVIDSKNNTILENYQFITVDDKYIYVVDDKNNLYVRDNEGSKYNEVGISLMNNDYVPGYMYDESGKLKKTMLSFKSTIEKNTIEIMPYTKKYEEDKNVSINILEGNLNKNLKYYNYFDGLLYFYADETKTNVIGSYKCSVVNNVTTNNPTLTNCLPATDTIFEDNDMMAVGEENRHSTIPMFNNRFVFVQDGAKNIILYDLVDKKAKSSYTQVNTYTPNNDYNFTSVTGDFNVVGVNKKGSYGIISIGASDVQAVYPFDYKQIEKVGTKFIAKTQADKWIILGGNGTEFKNKIRGYSKDLELVKTKGTNYEVLNSSGNVIDSNLRYVQFYDTYYAGVDKNNKLMLYTYEGYALLKDSVALGSSTYCRTNNPAFKVSTTADGKTRTFVISVLSGSEYKDVIAKEKTSETSEPEKPEKPEDTEKTEDTNKKENNEGDKENTGE